MKRGSTNASLTHPKSGQPRIPGRRLLLSWALQICLAALGIASLLEPGVTFLLLWCVAGTLYAVGVAWLLGRRSLRTVQPPLGWSQNPKLLPVTWVLTLVPVAIGVGSAVQVILSRTDPAAVVEVLGAGAVPLVRFLGVWGMLLGWGFLHWGFTHLYAIQDALAAPGKAIQFPQDDLQPGLVDYVYVAFTVGTTFAASDVSFLNTRIRWIVTVHSVLSFTLNALTIALAFNTIMGT